MLTSFDLFLQRNNQYLSRLLSTVSSLYILFYRSFVCLFVCLGSSVPFENFHSFGNITITGEGLQIFTCSRQSWPLSSEGSLTCHTYCNTGQLFIMVISEDQQPSHLLPSVWQWSCNYILKDLGLSQLGRTLYFYATTTV